jgi:hypothetical protein
MRVERPGVGSRLRKISAEGIHFDETIVNEYLDLTGVRPTCSILLEGHCRTLLSAAAFN